MNNQMRQPTARALLLVAALFITSVHSPAQDSVNGGRKILVKIQATYPDMAKTLQIKGTVKMEAQVAANGKVKSVAVKGGHPVLAQSAVDAVEKWRFEPAPHETREVIEIKFDLPD